MRRVAVTGLGVVAANGTGAPRFEAALRAGASGLRFDPRLEELKFSCQVVGAPVVSDAALTDILTTEQLRSTNSGMRFAALAAVECWRDAGFTYDASDSRPVDWNLGVSMGTGVGGMDTIADKLVPMTSSGQVRRLGSMIAEQGMCSGVSALVGGMLGAGAQVSTNSSACATGTEAIINGYRMIAHGYADRVVAGAAEGHSPYTAACFDTMRVTSRGWNDTPRKASRPLSATASGFVPAFGSGALMLEEYDGARDRGARIYAEIAGGAFVCGGQRNGGTMTSSNPEGVRNCIKAAVAQSGLRPEEIDYINGHLTATGNDVREINNLRCALQLDGKRFPWINATKSMIGHALGASGAIECVAALLQLEGGFLHASLNCEDLNPGAEDIAGRIPQACLTKSLHTVLKTSFGFGDVNACLIFSKLRLRN